MWASTTEKPLQLWPTVFMRVWHPAGYSASPAANWHLCTHSWFSSWDGWTYRKKMLSVSRRLCPAKPCGSSAAAFRGWGPDGADMACACKLPGVFPAEDELSAFSSRVSGERQLSRGLGKAIPSSLRHACFKLWSTMCCERVAQERGPVVFPPMCKWLAMCSG